jgi:hypothetical protein
MLMSTIILFKKNISIFCLKSNTIINIMERKIKIIYINFLFLYCDNANWFLSFQHFRLIQVRWTYEKKVFADKHYCSFLRYNWTKELCLSNFYCTFLRDNTTEKREKWNAILYVFDLDFLLEVQEYERNNNSIRKG